MVNKEELLKERYLLLKDKEDLEKAIKSLTNQIMVVENRL